MDQISREPELQTPVVDAHIENITNIAAELRGILHRMAKLQKRGGWRQTCHVLFRGEKDQNKLDNVLERLQKAKNSLMFQFSITLVGVTSRVEQKVQRIESGVYTAGEERNGLPVAGHHCSVLEGNESTANADQLNGIIGLECFNRSTTAKVVDNKALGNSRQRNIIAAGPASFKYLENIDGWS